MDAKMIINKNSNINKNINANNNNKSESESEANTKLQFIKNRAQYNKCRAAKLMFLFFSQY